jgi:hypothetical protein
MDCVGVLFWWREKTFFKDNQSDPAGFIFLIRYKFLEIKKHHLFAF